MLPSIGVAAVAGAAVSPAGVGTAEAWATTGSALAGICSFWPTLRAVVLLRLLARATSPMLTPSAFAIFQSESPFFTVCVFAADAGAGAAAGVAGCAGVMFWSAGTAGR